MANKVKFGVSIFFPCYNDSKSIGKLVRETFKTVRKITDNYEVIVINDGSTDDSPEVLNKLLENFNKLKIITHKKNKGYGGTLRTGFLKSSKDVIFYTDGDGQYDVEELPILVSLMTEDVDFINGIKMSRHDPTHRIVIGNIYSFLARWLFWLPIIDVDCDFRLIRKSLIKKINLKSNSGSICVELVKKSQRVGAKFRQVSVHHLERPFGQSQFFRWDKILQTSFELLNLWFDLMIRKKFIEK